MSLSWHVYSLFYWMFIQYKIDRKSGSLLVDSGGARWSCQGRLDMPWQGHPRRVGDQSAVLRVLGPAVPSAAPAERPAPQLLELP